MTTDTSIRGALEHFAQVKGTALAPKWDEELDKVELEGGMSDLQVVCGRLGWPAPVPQSSRPRADEFPMLVYDVGLGWVVAEQWENESSIRLSGLHLPLLEYHDGMVFHDVAFPDPLQGEKTPSAASIFWRATMKRKGVLVSAALA